MKSLTLIFFFVFVAFHLFAKEFHVAKTGNNSHPGTKENPFLTIQAAADVAQPGDIITIHEGVYREWVKPPRGGNSDTERIVYQAAEGDKVEIKGSEIINGWENLTGTVWRVVLPNSFFGDYNPYKDLIHGDWFNPLGRVHHTGEVYLNGKSLWEMALLEDVLHPKPKTDRFDPEGSAYTWFCESNDENTFIYANFQGADPNKEQVEINVRKSCFYSEKTGISFITVRGFRMSQAATQWAPPTAEQIGIIGTNWSKGWIIENNVISDSKCSGITLGKHGDEFDNTSENSAEGYVETIHRAIKMGWNKENIGSHRVRNNTIFNCEQTGICGSLGAIFSTIENNNIYNIWTKRQFTGAEMGGIKIHASIDMLIKNNRLANCGRGLWLDWMAQGTRVTGNLLYNNTTDDLFVEVNHGPFLIENNLFLSELSLRDWSQGGAYVHNLFAGNIEVRPQSRLTPFHLAHSTGLAGLKETRCGDNRFFNNIFVGGAPEVQGRFSGLKGYANTELPVTADGNVYLNGAQPFPSEKNVLQSETNPEIRVLEENENVSVRFDFDRKLNMLKTRTVTTELLGKAIIPNLPFKNRSGTPVKIDYDYFGAKRNPGKPTPGPFEKLQKRENRIKVW
ncbi:right-handed parallel beta-helix repeat-containing protein [Mariniphaga sp.]|uniref:right-handed parallel beta-helix repeat-containing protein n=1 Tax=Mariniphaga sp. TaxID=1954475 RepID=UPI003566C66A